MRALVLANAIKSIETWFCLMAFGWQMALFWCLLLLSANGIDPFHWCCSCFIWHFQMPYLFYSLLQFSSSSPSYFFFRLSMIKWANDTHFTREINAVEIGLMLFRVLNTDQRVNFSLLTVNQRQTVVYSFKIYVSMETSLCRISFTFYPISFDFLLLTKLPCISHFVLFHCIFLLIRYASGNVKNGTVT